jgi:hypothetical protein
MKKVAYKKESIAYNFPGLMSPVRQKAINDNSIPMLGLILKHSALMSFAFFAFYLIQMFV